MHKIHSVTGLGDRQHDSVVDKAISAFDYGAEKHEQGETHPDCHRCQILPVLFHHGRSCRSGTVVVGADEGDSIQQGKQRYANGKDLFPVPFQVHPDEMRQNQISRKPRYIVESRVWIPPALSENITSEYRSETIEDTGKQPYTKKKQFLFAAQAVQPRGNDRHYEIQSEQHIHEPQMGT